ncbi:MAG: DSD1 family PLP-dependent enzyme [Deltaproteobacteria bacterium]|nr:DSD1 family PLP-dependent enzyme [Deltaproteobacteria bacterium]
MKTSGKNKFDLDTPCLVLDLDLLETNLRKMQDAVNRAGKNLRPHAKTHKCSPLAQKQREAGAIGICAAKVSEAEALVKAGLGGILVTGPVPTPGKIKRLVEILAVDPSLMVVVDHREGVNLLDAALSERGLSMDVLLDVDVGLHRTGVKPAEALELADYILSRERLRLRGIQAYAGQVQHIRSYDDRKTASHQSLQEAVPLFRELEKKAETCTIFSSSGTGTFDIDLAVPEVTELQVGSYACMDAEYLDIGSAENDRQFTSFGPALRLLTTVVSTNQKGFVTVDAGLKSLYRDGGTPKIIGSESGMTYTWFGDEYGMVICPDPVGLPPIGTVLELVTSHCDPTINLFNQFYLIRGNDVVGVWPIDLRGCSQ